MLAKLVVAHAGQPAQRPKQPEGAASLTATPAAANAGLAATAMTAPPTLERPAPQQHVALEPGPAAAEPNAAPNAAPIKALSPEQMRAATQALKPVVNGEMMQAVIEQLRSGRRLQMPADDALGAPLPPKPTAMGQAQPPSSPR
jgi:hypothetical protein